MPNIPSKMSQCCLCGRLWAIVPPVLQIASSHTSYHLKSKLLTYVICRWVPKSCLLSNSYQLVPYRRFFHLFECSDLKWVTRTFDVSRACTTSTKFSKPLKWMYIVPILFIKLIFSKSYVFFHKKYWLMSTRSLFLPVYPTQTKKRSSLRIGQ